MKFVLKEIRDTTFMADVKKWNMERCLYSRVNWLLNRMNIVTNTSLSSGPLVKKSMSKMGITRLCVMMGWFRWLVTGTTELILTVRNRGCSRLPSWTIMVIRFPRRNTIMVNMWVPRMHTRNRRRSIIMNLTTGLRILRGGLKVMWPIRLSMRVILVNIACALLITGEILWMSMTNTRSSIHMEPRIAKSYYQQKNLMKNRMMIRYLCLPVGILTRLVMV